MFGEFLEGRKIGTLTVTISAKDKEVDATSVMMRWATFTNMVRQHNLSILSTEGTQITLQGRNRDLRKFEAQFDLGNRLGLV